CMFLEPPPRETGACTSSWSTNNTTGNRVPGFYKRVKDSDVSKMQVTCPAGFQMASIELIEGCNSESRGSHLIDNVSGVCFQATANKECGSAPYGFTCRAYCCR